MSLIIDNVNPSWNEFINNDEIVLLLTEIEKSIGDNYFPKKENVLRFLSLDLSKVKYILLGMDPYHSYYTKNNINIPIATGRSFEVSNYDDWTKKTKNKSLTNILKNIYGIYNKKASIKEIRDAINNGTFDILKPNDWFDSMEKQGLLFLNTSFTVDKIPGSHMSYWLPFTSKLINYINDNNSSVVWILLGDDAINIGKKFIPDDRKITACHPAVEKFVDEDVFSKIEDINWKGK